MINSLLHAIDESISWIETNQVLHLDHFGDEGQDPPSEKSSRSSTTSQPRSSWRKPKSDKGKQKSRPGKPTWYLEPIASVTNTDSSSATTDQSATTTKTGSESKLFDLFVFDYSLRISESSDELSKIHLEHHSIVN